MGIAERRARLVEQRAEWVDWWWQEYNGPRTGAMEAPLARWLLSRWDNVCEPPTGQPPHPLRRHLARAGWEPRTEVGGAYETSFRVLSQREDLRADGAAQGAGYFSAILSRYCSQIQYLGENVIWYVFDFPSRLRDARRIRIGRDIDAWGMINQSVCDPARRTPPGLPFGHADRVLSCWRAHMWRRGRWNSAWGNVNHYVRRAGIINAPTLTGYWTDSIFGHWLGGTPRQSPWPAPCNRGAHRSLVPEERVAAD